MGVCQTQKRKIVQQQTQPSPMTSPKAAEQQNLETNTTRPVLSQKLNHTILSKVQKHQILHGNPFKYYTILPKECQIALNFKIYQVQHNLSGQLRGDLLIDKINESAFELYKKLKYTIIDHPNICKLYEIYKYQDQYHLIIETCRGGPLEYLTLKTLSEYQIGIIMTQIMQAIYYLHQQNLFHGKITLDSFQLVNDSGDLNIKLCDTYNIFNKSIPNENQSLYIAPEGCSDISVKPKITSDVWAAGVIFYYLLSGYFPFDKQQSIEKAIHQLRRGQIAYDLISFEKRSKASTKLLKRMLNFDSKQRISPLHVLQDSFFEVCLNSRSNNAKKSFIIFQKAKQKPNYLQLAILKYMLNQFGTENQQNLFNSFSLFDINKDGKLNRDEVQQVYEKLFPELDAVKEAQLLFNAADFDQSGDIDLDEFLLATIDRDSLVNKNNLEICFKLFDINKSGKVSARRFSEILMIEEQNTLSIITSFNRLDSKDAGGGRYGKNFLTLEGFKKIMFQIL